MNIEEQVLSIEQAKHLQKLGLDMSDAALAWYPPFIYDYDGLPKNLVDDIDNYSLTFNEYDHDTIPAYTLQEVLGKLPNHIVVGEYDYYLEMNRDYWMAYYRYTYSFDGDERDYIDESSFQGDNFTIVAYNLLCWVIENGYLKEDNK